MRDFSGRGCGFDYRVLGLYSGFPGDAKVAKLRLDAFDLQPHRAAAGEVEDNVSARRFGFFVSDGEQFRECVRFSGVDVLHLGAS